MEISENFASKLKKLVEARTKPDGSSPGWRPTAFLAAVAAAHADKPGAFVPETYNNWTNGKHGPPHRKTVEAICSVLCETRAEVDPATRARLEALRQELIALSESGRTRRSGRKTPRTGSEAATATLEPHCRREMANLPMVDLNIETPPQGSTPDRFALLVDVRLGLEPCQDDSDYEFGLNRLTVHYQEENCRPVGKRHGEDGTVPGLKAIAGGWQLSAPAGEPLTEAHRLVEILAMFERDGEGAPSVALKPSAQTSDVVTTLKGSAANLPPKARGVLSRYLVAKNFPKKGIIEFGQASLTYKPAGTP